MLHAGPGRPADTGHVVAGLGRSQAPGGSDAWDCLARRFSPPVVAPDMDDWLEGSSR